MYVGTDIEFFLKTQDGLIASQQVLQGTKTEPMMYNTFVLHRDNVLAEVATPVVGLNDNSSDLYTTVANAKETLLSVLPDDVELVTVPEAIMPESQMRGNREAMQSGCSPDFDAYEARLVPRVKMKPLGNMRFAGGHLHLNCIPTPEEQRKHVAMCDFMFGLPSLVWDTLSNERRKHYGSASRFRPKSYGIEYRTLSNVWTLDEQITKYIYRVCSVINTDGTYKVLDDSLWRRVREIINTGSSMDAAMFMEEYSPVYQRYTSYFSETVDAMYALGETLLCQK